MSADYLKDGESVTFDREGNIIKRSIAKDGDRVRIGMLMLDTAFKSGVPTLDAAHKPRQMLMSDVDTAQRLASRQRYVNRLNDAYRQPQPEAPAVVAARAPAPARLPAPTVTADRSLADAAYQRRNLRLESAWKEPL